MKVKSIILAFAIFASIACSSAQIRQNSVTTYEAVGVAIVTYGKAVKPLCDANLLSTEDCNQAQTIYAQAATYYMEAGGLLQEAIEAESDIESKDYAELIGHIIDIIKAGNEIIKKASAQAKINVYLPYVDRSYKATFHAETMLEQLNEFEEDMEVN